MQSEVVLGLANSSNVSLFVEATEENLLLLNVSKPHNHYPSDLFILAQLQQGAILLHVAGVAYVFIAMATICDEFLLPSLDLFARKLRLSEDVAGATIVAASGSLADFFTALVGQFASHSTVGVSTIVGSGGFSMFCVVALCAIFSGAEMLRLNAWPLCRDVVFCMLALAALLTALADKKMTIIESLSVFTVYLLYVLVLCYNAKVESFFKKIMNWSLYLCCGCCQKPYKVPPEGDLPEGRTLQIPAIYIIEEDSVHVEMDQHKPKPLPDLVAPLSLEPRRSSKQRRTSIIRVMFGSGKCPTTTTDSNRHRHHTSPSSTNASKEPLEELDAKRSGSLDLSSAADPRRDSSLFPRFLTKLQKGESLPTAISDERQLSFCVDQVLTQPLQFAWPKTLRRRIAYVIVAPIVFSMAATIPDVRRPACKKLFPLSLLMCNVWLAALSYLSLWWATTIGRTIGISDEVMGLTLLAAGSSVPDLLNSILVTRRNQGDMAVCSSLGGTIFSTTVGLQIPWLLDFAIKAARGLGTAALPLESRGLACTVLLLMFCLLLLIVLLMLFRWKVGKSFGLVLLFLYGGYIAFVIAIELGHVSCPLTDA